MTTAELEPFLDPTDCVALARTFVDFARCVSEGADIVEVYSMLSDRCVEVLAVEACGILLVDLRGALRVIGSSSSSVELLDLFQVQNDVGPCLTCCRTGEAVSDEELSPDGPWPEFSALARREGFNAVHAIPLRARDTVFGAMNIFSVGPLSADRLAVARVMADAATVALLQADPSEDAIVATRRLQIAIESRNAIDQAVGIVAQRFGLSIDDAIERLRSISRRSGLGLVELATMVVARDGREPASLRRIEPD